MARILFDANPIADQHKTGVGYYLNSLMSELSKSTRNQYVGYYFNFLRKKTKSFSGQDYQAITLLPGKILSLTRRLGFQPPLELFTSTKQSDIVFYTNYVSLPTLRKRKKVLAVYDLGFLDCPEFMQPVNLSYLQRFCPPSIMSADLIITISEFTKQQLHQHFPDMQADIVVTPIPPMTPRTQGTAALSSRLAALGIQPNGYILYLGTIEPRKNIKRLVEAYAELPRAIRARYALVLAGGKGWKDEEIIKIIRQKQAEGLAIIQTGYISDDEKTALYAHARCFTLLSHYEGFGMPALEAMQHGLPILLSDIPVFHEVAGKAAHYCDKDETTAIKTALETILTDEQMRTRLISAGTQQLASFSWEHNAALVEDAFSRLT